MGTLTDMEAMLSHQERQVSFYFLYVVIKKAKWGGGSLRKYTLCTLLHKYKSIIQSRKIPWQKEKKTWVSGDQSSSQLIMQKIYSSLHPRHPGSACSLMKPPYLLNSLLYKERFSFSQTTCMDSDMFMYAVWAYGILYDTSCLSALLLHFSAHIMLSVLHTCRLLCCHSHGSICININTLI